MACSSASMRITVPHWPNTSAGSAATCAPSFRKGSHLSAVRFHTTRSVPDVTRFDAIGSPISPSPMNPVLGEVSTAMPPLPGKTRTRSGRPRRPRGPSRAT